MKYNAIKSNNAISNNNDLRTIFDYFTVETEEYLALSQFSLFI